MSDDKIFREYLAGLEALGKLRRSPTTIDKDRELHLLVKGHIGGWRKTIDSAFCSSV